MEAVQYCNEYNFVVYCSERTKVGYFLVTLSQILLFFLGEGEVVSIIVTECHCFPCTLF